MPEAHWETVAEIAGDLPAEILAGLLQAKGIPVWLSQEGAGKVYGLTVSGLGTVHLMVSPDRLEEARAIIDAYYQGQFEDEELVPGDELEDDTDTDLEEPEED